MVLGIAIDGRTEENPIPEKTPRELRIERELSEFNGKSWVFGDDKSKTYTLKIYCEDENGEGDCREFPNEQEEIEAQEYAAQRQAEAEQRALDAQAKKDRMNELGNKPGALTQEEIKEALRLLSN